MENKPNKLYDHYLEAVLSGSRNTALSLVMDMFHAETSISHLYVNILQEAMYTVGKLWETNQITVADEHRATAITQFVMSNLYGEMEIKPQSQGTAVLTGVQGELHQVGIAMVADILEANGWNVAFLGSNTPHNSVLASLESNRASILGISVTMFYHIPQVVELVKAARTRYQKDSLKIILGGCGIRMLSSIPESLSHCYIGRDLFEVEQLLKRFSLPI